MDRLVERYYNLYEAYVAIQIKNRIEPLGILANQMKNVGLSHKEILRLRPVLKDYIAFTRRVRHYFDFLPELSDPQRKALPNQFLEALMSGNKSDALLSKFFEENDGGDTLKHFIKDYRANPDRDKLDQVYFKLHRFAGMSYEEQELLFDAASVPSAGLFNDIEKRVNLELQSRIGGHEGSRFDYGAVPGNPLAIKKAIFDKSCKNPKTAFRNKAYFLYRSNTLANEILEDPTLSEEINDWLEYAKGWRLNSEVLNHLRTRAPSGIPPLMYYGGNANLNNKGLRTVRSPEKYKEWTMKDPNPTYSEMLQNEADGSDGLCKRYKTAVFSSAEVLLHTGELTEDITMEALRELPPDVNMQDESLVGHRLRNTKGKMGTGAHVFDMEEDPSQVTDDQARRYLEGVQDLKLPVKAGISGTLDQSISMAAMVDIHSVAGKPIKNTLEDLRLAYIAFMVNSDDHSVHEIMQSSKTYGLDYVASQDYYKQIYPRDPEFLEKLKLEQRRRNLRLPDYYLSEKYLREIGKAD